MQQRDIRNSHFWMSKELERAWIYTYLIFLWWLKVLFWEFSRIIWIWNSNSNLTSLYNRADDDETYWEQQLQKYAALPYSRLVSIFLYHTYVCFLILCKKYTYNDMNTYYNVHSCL